MGYETRIHVVKLYEGDTHRPQHGEEIASLDIRNCGDGAVAMLIGQYTKKEGDPAFSLAARNPDRQYEAVEYLREIAEAGSPKSQDYVEKLASDIEDGEVTRDKYEDILGVIPLDEFILALEANIASESPPYRRFVWALGLIKLIWDDSSYVDRKSYRVVTYGH